MEKIEISFYVVGKRIKREIKKPNESLDVIYDLYREFVDFENLQFLYKGAWITGAEYDVINNL